MDIEIRLRLTFDANLDHSATQELEDRLHEILNREARESGALAPEGFSIYDYEFEFAPPEEE